MADRPADGSATFGKLGDVVGVEADERGADDGIEFRFGDEMTVSLGGDGEAVGDVHSLSAELADHLAERGVLAADERDVLDARVREPFDEGAGVHDFVGLAVIRELPAR